MDLSFDTTLRERRIGSEYRTSLRTFNVNTMLDMFVVASGILWLPWSLITPDHNHRCPLYCTVLQSVNKRSAMFTVKLN